MTLTDAEQWLIHICRQVDLERRDRVISYAEFELEKYAADQDGSTVSKVDFLRKGEVPLPANLEYLKWIQK